MTLADITTEDLNSAINRSLQALEGGTYDDWNRPYVWTAKPLATPPVVIYRARDGKTYERTFEIDVQGEVINVVLGEGRKEVEARTVWVPVEFALPAAFTEDGDFIIREGKVFECGFYADKDFGLTHEEADAAIAAGVPVPNDLEHIPTVLTQTEDGKKRTDILGDTLLTRREGDALFGKVRIPKWLHDKSGDKPIKVSATWNRVTKALEGMALCLNPRITDAAVFASFVASPVFPDFAAKHPSEAAQIVTEAASAPAPAKEDMDKPTITQRITAFFAGKTPEQRAALTEAEIADAVFANTTATAPTYTPDPAIVARLEKVERDGAENAKFAIEKQDKDDALAFYCDQVEAGKVEPNPDGKAKCLEDFSLRRFKDRHSLANFSANAEGSAERALREEYKAKPVLFRVGPSLIDSGAQPQFKEGTGIFAETDFKKETAA